MLVGKFTEFEKVQIKTMIEAGSNYKDIASKLNRKENSIYTEIRRNPHKYGSNLNNRQYTSKKTSDIDLIKIPSLDICFNLKSIYKDFKQSDIDSIVMMSEKEKKKIEEIKNNKLKKSLKGSDSL